MTAGSNMADHLTPDGLPLPDSRWQTEDGRRLSVIGYSVTGRTMRVKLQMLNGRPGKARIIAYSAKRFARTLDDHKAALQPIFEKPEDEAVVEPVPTSAVAVPPPVQPTTTF